MTEQTKTPRPVIVTVLGVLFLLLGLVMLPAALMGLVSVAIMGNVYEPIPAPSGTGFVFGTLSRYVWLLCLAQFGLGVLTVVASVRFLQLRAWARTALETLTWFGALWVVGFGVFWILNWLQMTSHVSEELSGEGFGRAFSMVGAIGGVLFVLFYGAAAGLVIWALRSRTVREAILPGGAAAPPVPGDSETPTE